jgi:hypothetical protein
MRTASIVIMVVGLFLGRGYMGGLFMGPWLATKIASHVNPKIPSDFPNDVPVYPNFQLDEVQKTAGIHMLELRAKSDAQTVLAFYRQQLEAYGWQVSPTTQEETDDGDGFGITASKEGRMVGVVVTPSQDGQSVVRQMVR